MGLAGAGQVVGLDTDAPKVANANAILAQYYPQLKSVVSFESVDLKDYDKMQFDCVISKDSFEHIIDVEGMVAQMKAKVKPGGRLYTGFGPLYNSPFGHHGRTKTPLPWGHLLAGEKKIIERLNRDYRSKGERAAWYWEGEAKSMDDLGLNMKSLADFRRAFYNSGMDVEFFGTNQSDSLLSKTFSLICKIPFLEEYFTHNVYCILQKKKD